MYLASDIIDRGRHARRVGIPFHDNPHEETCKEDRYADMGVPPNNWLAMVDLDWHGLWSAGWKIEDKYGDKS